VCLWCDPKAFNEPAFPVDTHVHRLALRWGLSKSQQDVKKVEADLKVTTHTVEEKAW
jgi:endonuclease III